MISRCPDCHFLHIVEDGCSICLTGKYAPKEVNHKDTQPHARKVEGSTGEDMPSPVVQLELAI